MAQSNLLHAEAVAYMEQLARLEMLSAGECSVAELRAAGIKRRLMIRPALEPVGTVMDRQIPGPAGEIPIRIYQPDGISGPCPIVMVFHGGGWVTGDLDSEDVTARGLCRRVGATVISVDYRLAPETRFPGAAEDCYAATQWAMDNATSLNGDASMMAVAGTSAGGNLAAVVSLMSRDCGGPVISHQVLFCPVTDFDFERASCADFAEGFGLTAEGMRWFWEQYIGAEEDFHHPYASPLRADSLVGLPDATVIVAECDVLRDEGEAYARRLADAGVDARLTRYEGMIHGFNLQLDLIHAAETAIEEASDRIKDSFSAISAD